MIELSRPLVYLLILHVFVICLHGVLLSTRVLMNGDLAKFHGTRRDRVQQFLLGALQLGSLRLYTTALESFKADCDRLGLDYHALPPEEQDWVLAEYLLDMREVNHEQRQKGVLLVAALTKIDPGRRMRVSQRVLLRWATELPKKEAPAIPRDLLMAIVVVLQLSERTNIATVLLLCYTGLLRVSEVLQLQRRQLVLGDSYIVLSLDRTKRGVNEKVVIRNHTVVRWMQAFLVHSTARNHERLFPVSYSTVSKWLVRTSSWLGFGELRLTSHSMRRGGATELHRQGVSYMDIALYGRWAAEQSVRTYLREGDLALTHAEHRFAPDLWRRVSRIASFHDAVWRYHDLGNCGTGDLS